MFTRFHAGRTAALIAAVLAPASAAFAAPDFPPFEEVSKGYEKVVSTADGKASLYGVYFDKKNNQLLAELPRGYANQRHLIAVTQASGGVFAGLQGPQAYVYWKRYGKRIALVAPEVGTRSTGEAESKSSVKRLFTDRVLVDVPIVAMGPSGQPVIDLDDLLVKQSGRVMGGARGRTAAPAMNSRLTTVTRAKAFPQNIEIALESPAAGGQLQGFHFSISNVPKSSGYKPRVADERIGYFTTVYRDLGEYQQDTKWKRYVNRWHLEKRDPKLTLSPPKEPIIYYLEHTVPVRYRRWVRQGVEYWNDAFRAVGIDNAIEVRIQDKVTGAHMEKDPENIEHNFIRWLNNDISTAIGPSRAHPETGQILDADIVLTDGWIRAYWGWYHEQMPELATESFNPETLAWFEEYPDWDPRLLMSTPERRREIRTARATRAAGEMPETSNVLTGDSELTRMAAWTGQGDNFCLAARGKAFDMMVAGLHLQAFIEMDGAEGQALDGIPEWFVGPMVSELTCHEVGHTLGLRHNFKASSLYSMEQINSEEFKGNKPLAGSVMDYLPANIAYGVGETQGDFTMIGVGPYDMWAIEYGYTFEDPKEVLTRSATPELAYLTDDDTGGPDPLARRYDFTADPLDFCENQMRLVDHHRSRILESFVKDGQSWSKARTGYGITLSLQTRALSMMANWIGGAHVNRARKGDPDATAPIAVVDPEQQRKALAFVIENTFYDEAYGLTPELLVHMTVDKWSDNSPGDRSDPTWPVHDRVSGMQASALSMIMNPTTLRRVYDNELRTPIDQDAVTIPEILDALDAAIFAEFDTELNGVTFTNRQPMVTSLRRSLQSTMVDRLIAM
ncbi:MAG: zinc-dependent metalloprotease, partial [Planctomycetota bacterium]